MLSVIVLFPFFFGQDVLKSFLFFRVPYDFHFFFFLMDASPNSPLCNSKVECLGGPTGPGGRLP